nr:TonB-dependent receptor [Sphingomonas bacterium]
MVALMAGLPAYAQAPETQTQTSPAEAQDRAADQAGAANNPGPGNTPSAANAAPAAAAPNASGVEEIVVTAQFREQNLQDTPIAITAVSGAMLEARSQTNISQVANQAPSVTLKPQGSQYGASLSANIRGVGQFDFNPALEPGVGVYVDDVYYATLTGSIFDLLDLERVEVLRGPQGTLAGKNSIGGAIKLFSKRPTGSNTGYVQAAYGSRNRLDLRGSADFGLAEGLNARIAGVAKKQGGYVKRLDFGCVYPAGGSATFVNAAGATLPINPAGGVPVTAGGGSNCVLAKEGEVDYQAVRGQLRWEASDAIEVNIIGDYTHDDRNTAATVLLERNFPNGAPASPNFPPQTVSSGVPGPTGVAQNYSTAPPPRDINPYGAGLAYDRRFVCGQYCNFGNYLSAADTQPTPGAFATLPTSVANGRTKFAGWGVSGQVEWKLSDDLQLTSISAYRSYDSDFTNDDDVSPLAHSLGISNLDFWSFSQELRLNGSLFDEFAEYTLGGFYMKQKSVYASLQDIRYAALYFYQNDPVRADTKAAFAHLTLHPTEKLTLTGGLRYTDERKDYTYVRLNPQGGLLPGDPSGNGPALIPGVRSASPVAGLNGKRGVYDGPESTRFDYRVNAMYEITPDISAYGQISTGFKGGGVNPRPFFNQQVLPFGPEKLTAFELGFKSDLFDRRLRINAAAFLSKYKDIQLSLSNCTAQAGQGFGVPCALIVNAGDADIKGFELETSLRPVDGMIIDASLSYLDFKYKKFATFAVPDTRVGAAPGSTVNVSVGGTTNLNGPQFGDYPAYTPKWKWSVGAQYEVDLGNAGTVTPRLDAAFQDDLFFNATNRPSNKIEDYVVANARLTWANTDKDLEVSAEVTNLFDKYYLLTGFDLTLAGSGFASGQPGRPREWAVSVKKKF